MIQNHTIRIHRIFDNGEGVATAAQSQGPGIVEAKSYPQAILLHEKATSRATNTIFPHNPFVRYMNYRIRDSQQVAASIEVPMSHLVVHGMTGSACQERQRQPFSHIAHQAHWDVPRLRSTRGWRYQWDGKVE